MEQTSSTTLTWPDCELTFTHTGSVKSKPKRCETCREERKKALAREAAQRFMDRAQPERHDDPICKRCERVFERPNARGRRPDYCDSCRLEIKRAAGRAHMAANYVKRVPGVPEIFNCPDCDEPFEYTRGQGRSPVRCRPCQKERNNAKTAERRAVKGRSDLKFAPGERIYPCIICDADIACAATGRKPLYCDDCKKLRVNERGAPQQRTYQPRPVRQIVCIGCDVTVTLPLRGASRQKRCADCATKAARVIQKRMGHERRAIMHGADSEVFTHKEIFDRDGWICGLCHKKIDKRLKHGHPMAVQLDHIIPFTKGGGHLRTNVQASHRICNNRKYNLGGGEQLMLIG